MVNYVMTEGAKRNKRIKIAKWVVGIAVVVGVVAGILYWSSKRDAQLMSINYCWDEQGEHYLAPNPACR